MSRACKEEIAQIGWLITIPYPVDEILQREYVPINALLGSDRLGLITKATPLPGNYQLRIVSNFTAYLDDKPRRIGGRDLIVRRPNMDG